MERHVTVLPEADKELLNLSRSDRRAMVHALDKLRVRGEELPFPHASQVVSVRPAVWELRPSGGHNAWRGFYRRVGDVMVVAAFGPDAKVNARGFERAVRAAQERLQRWEAAR